LLYSQTEVPMWKFTTVHTLTNSKGRHPAASKLVGRITAVQNNCSVA